MRAAPYRSAAPTVNAPGAGPASGQFAEPLPQGLQLCAQPLVLGDRLPRALGVMIELGIRELDLELADARLALLDVPLDAGRFALPLLASSAFGSRCARRRRFGRRLGLRARALRARAGVLRLRLRLRHRLARLGITRDAHALVVVVAA